MTVLDGHVAIAEETTYGTPVATTRGVLLDPKQVSIEETFENLATSVRLPGQAARTTTFTRAFMGASGSVPLEVLDKGAGVWLKHLLGGVSNVVHPVEATMRRMTFTPDGAAKALLSLTTQLFRPYYDLSGKAHTYMGTVVLGATFKVDVGGNLMATFNVDGRDVATSGDVVTGSISSGSANVTVTSTVGMAVGSLVVGTGIPVSTTIASITSSTVFVLSANATATNAAASLTISRGATVAKATPTYASGAQPFAWTGCTFTLDGQSACASGFELKWEWALNVDRRKMCNGGLKAVPIMTDVATGTLTLTGVEYLAPAAAANQQYNRYASLTAASSIASFSGTCLTAAPAANVTKGKIQFDVASAAATAGTPNMSGEQPVVFDILGSPGVTITYDTLDATP